MKVFMIKRMAFRISPIAALLAMNSCHHDVATLVPSSHLPTKQQSIEAPPAEWWKSIEADTAEEPEPQQACPVGMISIEGNYCPTVVETCISWVDSLGHRTSAPVGDASGRCGEFMNPTRCLSSKLVHMKYCIDEYEYPNIKGQKPQSWMSWREVKNACEDQGKRLCTKSEWTFSCEGQDIKPYPYGDGYHRDRTSCNTDNDQTNINVHADSKEKRMLDKLLAPAGAHASCVSTFGVHDLVGNIDEFVVNEGGSPYKSSLVGGHVFGVRNACRPSTDGHNEDFSWYESGGRCCASTQPEPYEDDDVR